jgi:hypothetical protein
MFQENSHQCKSIYIVHSFQSTIVLDYPNVDYDCLRRYDENNTHFSMAIILENREGEQERAIGYDCIYRFDIHRVKLEYDIASGLWKTIPEEFSNILFNDIQSLSLDEQIQIIIIRLDQQFFGLIKSKTKYSSINRF